MAQSDEELKQYALKKYAELKLRELSSSSGSTGEAAQKAAPQVPRSPQDLRSMSPVGIGAAPRQDAQPMVQGISDFITAQQQGAQDTMGNILKPADPNYDGPQLSNSSKLANARLYQGINWPFAAGEAGNQFLESNPTAQKGAVQMEEQLGPVGAGALQFAGQFVPQMGEMAAMGTLGALGKAGEAASQVRMAVPTLFPKITQAITGFAKGAAGAAGLNALGAALGAPEGQRFQAAGQQLDPSNPMALGMAALGGVHGAASPFFQEKLPNALFAGEGDPMMNVNEAVLRLTRERGGFAKQPEPNVVKPSTFEMTNVGGKPVKPFGGGFPKVTPQEAVRLSELPNVLPEDMVGPRVDLISDEARYGSPVAEPTRMDTILRRSPMANDIETRVLPGREGKTSPGLIDVSSPDHNEKIGLGFDNPDFRKEFVFTDPSNGKTFDVIASLMGGKEVWIHSVKPTGARFVDEPGALAHANSIGPASMRQLAADFVTYWPLAERILGVRATGAKAGKNVNVKLPEGITQIENGLWHGGPVEQTVTKARTPMDIAKIGVDIGGGSGPPKPPPIPPLEFDKAAWERESTNAVLKVSADPRAASSVPPEPPLPEQAPQSFGDEGDVAAKFLENWNRERNPSIRQKLRQWFSLPEQRTSFQDEAARIRGLQGAQAIRDLQFERLYPQLKKAALSNGRAGKRLVDQYVKQVLDKDAPINGSKVTFDMLPEAFRSLWETGVKQMDSQRMELIKNNYFTVDQLEKIIDFEKQGIPWLHRDLMAVLDRKGFKPDTGLVNRTIDWVVKHAQEPVTRAEAGAMLQEMTKATGSPEQRYLQSTLGSKILKERKLPSILADLMGQVHDGPFVFANSMAEIEQLWRQHKETETIMSPQYKGLMWDDRPNMNMVQAKLPGQDAYAARRSFGMLADKWVTPEIFEAMAIKPAFDQKHIALDFISKPMSWFRFGKVMLDPVVWMKDVTGNTLSSAATGLPVYHPMYGPRQAQAIKSWLDYHKAFTTPESLMTSGGSRNWMQMALEDQAVRPGNGLGAGGQALKNVVQAELRTPDGGFVGLIDKGLNAIDKGRLKVTELRELTDSIPRLAAYIHQVTNGVKKGMPLRAARDRAAAMVNENFISSANTGPAVKQMSKLAGIGSQPFLGWYADSMRVGANWMNPKALTTPEGRARAIHVSMSLGMMAAGLKLWRYMAGTTDQEVHLATKELKSSYASYHPFNFVMPGRDDNGRQRVLSLDSAIPFAGMLNGNNRLDPSNLSGTAGGFFQDLATNMMRNPLKGSLAGVGMDTLMKRYGLLPDEYTPRDAMPGEGGAQFRQDAWDWLKPGIIKRGEDVMRRTETATELVDQLRKHEERLTLGQALSKFTPFPVEPVGPRSNSGETARLVVSEKELRMQRNAAMKKASSTEERKQIQQGFNTARKDLKTRK